MIRIQNIYKKYAKLSRRLGNVEIQKQNNIP